MKKLILSTLLVMMACCMQAQNTDTVSDNNLMRTTSSSNTVLRQSIRVPIHKMVAKGKCGVMVTADTAQYIELLQNPFMLNDSLIHPEQQSVTIEDGVLTIRSSVGALYNVHLDMNTTPVETVVDGESSIKIDYDGSKHYDKSLSVMTKVGKLMAPFLEAVGANNVTMNEMEMTEYPEDYLEEEYPEEYPEKDAKKGRDLMNRFWNFDFGLHNWGNSIFSGLVGSDDPGYDIRTSLSSYQISWHLSLLTLPCFEMGMGFGYRSDVYKFRQPHVEYVGNAFTTATPDDGWKTKFTNRSLQLPIHIAFCGANNRFTLYAIPALAYCGRHTGLKHSYQSGSPSGSQAYTDRTNLKSSLNPFQLDFRLEYRHHGLGAFVQMSTQPIFKEGPKIYPMQVGFTLCSD